MKVLVISTGRSGTRSITNILNDMFKMNGLTYEAKHETFSSYLYEGINESIRIQRTFYLDRILNKLDHFAEVGNGFQFVLPHLHRLFGSELKIIHLIREHDFFLKSVVKHCLMSPKTWDNFLEDTLPTKSSIPTAYELGDMSETSWRALSFEEKLSWYWHRTNDLVAQHAELFDNRFTLYTHELNDSEKLKEIAEFLELDSERLPMPAHTNKFFATDNQLWEKLPAEKLIHHHRRMSNFDMNKAFFEEKYGVEYFLDYEIKKYKQERSPQRLEYLNGLVDKINRVIKNEA